MLGRGAKGRGQKEGGAVSLPVQARAICRGSVGFGVWCRACALGSDQLSLKRALPSSAVGP